MLQGLAIWHYPHRSIAENLRYFAARGFDSLSVHGAQLVNALSDPSAAADIASAVRESGVALTVHYCLPRNHGEEAVEVYRRGIAALAAWQNEHSLISILSFDVPQPVREGEGILAYVEHALKAFPSCRIAVEDFGLNASERAQILPLKGEPRFGYLVDVGHLFLRLRGRHRGGKTIFTHAPDEHPLTDFPTSASIHAALASKEHPIFEIHLHNNDGAEDLHWFLEQGELDIAAVAQALQDMDYKGIVTIESAPGYKFECRGAHADEGILKTFDYWKGLLG